jgi:hypothetical protein
MAKRITPLKDLVFKVDKSRAGAHPYFVRIHFSGGQFSGILGPYFKTVDDAQHFINRFIATIKELS